MTSAIEYIHLWKTHGSASNVGDYKTCNRAMKQLIKIFKTFEQDPDSAADLLGPLLKDEDSWVASGVASHCLALGVHVQDALSVLRKISACTNDLSALSADMLLKQWNKQGYILVYKGQMTGRQGDG